MTTACVNDEILLQDCLQGNRDKFAELIERYQSLVCAITYNATGNVSHSEELAQETFVIAWRKLQDLHDLQKFRSWLCGIARNVTKEWRRKQPKTINLDHPSIVDGSSLTDTVITPMERAMNKEEEVMLWRAIETIPDKYRMPLILFYREQQSIEKVADLLELNEDVVKQRLSRGRKMVKEQLSSFVESALGKSYTERSLCVCSSCRVPRCSASGAAAAGLAISSAKGSLGAKVAATVACSGALLGVFLGLLGGIFGIWNGYRNCKSDPERRYVYNMGMRGACYGILFFIVTFAVMWVLKPWVAVMVSKYSQVFLLPLITCVAVIYSLGLVLFIKRWNTRLKEIQIEQGTYIDQRQLYRQSLERPVRRNVVMGSFGGMIFGCVAWIYNSSIIVGNWFIPLYVTAVALILFGAAIRVMKNRILMHPVMIVAACVLYCLNLVVINAHWTLWKTAIFVGFSQLFVNLFATLMLICVLAMIIQDSRQKRRWLAELENEKNPSNLNTLKN